jgi:hypothetical protein
VDQVGRFRSAEHAERPVKDQNIALRQTTEIRTLAGTSEQTRQREP